MKEWFLGDIPLREFTIVWQSRQCLPNGLQSACSAASRRNTASRSPCRTTQPLPPGRKFSSVRPAGRIFFFNRMSML